MFVKCLKSKTENFKFYVSAIFFNSHFIICLIYVQNFFFFCTVQLFREDLVFFSTNIFLTRFFIILDGQINWTSFRILSFQFNDRYFTKVLKNNKIVIIILHRTSRSRTPYCIVRSCISPFLIIFVSLLKIA